MKSNCSTPPWAKAARLGLLLALFFSGYASIPATTPPSGPASSTASPTPAAKSKPKSTSGTPATTPAATPATPKPKPRKWWQSATPAPPPATPAPATPVPATPKPRTSEEGRERTARKNTAVTRFTAEVQGALRDSWTALANQRLATLESGAAKVSFDVAPDGHVEKVEVSDNSSNEAFAALCKEAAENAKIPALPDDVIAKLPDGVLHFSQTLRISLR